MNYYSEKEIRRILEPIMDFYVLDHSIQKMTPIKLITMFSSDIDSPTKEFVLKQSQDRERIRMELWKDVYVKNSYEPVALLVAGDALAAFDKQFPNV